MWACESQWLHFQEICKQSLNPRKLEIGPVGVLTPQKLEAHISGPFCFLVVFRRTDLPAHHCVCVCVCLCVCLCVCVSVCVCVCVFNPIYR